MATTSAAATTTTAPSANKVDFWNLMFGVDLACRYHLSRGSFLFRVEKMSIAVVTFASLCSAFGCLSQIMSGMCFLIATVILATDPAKLASAHERISAEFSALLTEMELAWATGDIGIERYGGFHREAARISRKEGREYYRAVEADCRNDVIRFRQCDPSSLIPLPPLVRALRHWYPFSNIG